MALQSWGAPYVHSNYYLFSRQLREHMFSIDEQKGMTRMDEQISALKKVRDGLYEEAKAFLGNDTPKIAYRKIIEGDTEISRIGKQVIADPAARKALLRTTYTKKEVTDIIKPGVLEELAEKIVEELDIKELAEAISKELFDKGFGKQSRAIQIEQLKQIFNIDPKVLDRILNDFLKGKLRSSSGKIQKIVKEILAQKKKEDSGENGSIVYENFIRYFERAVKDRARQSGLYSTNIDIVTQYLERVKPKLKNIIKQQYSITDASRALGEEIHASVNENSGLVEIAVGDKTEREIRADNNLIPSLETATTWNDPNKMSYTDLILINSNGMRVRAQSKNYVEAYGTFLRTKQDGTKQDVYQSTHLFSRKMLFKEFFMKLMTESGGRINIAGEIDLDTLSYIVANEIWFDMHGSIDKGSSVGWRTGKVHTRLFDSDSWLSRALSGAFVNFLGIVVSESGEVIPSISNVFFLIDNEALVPTYELIDNVIKYYENGMAQMVNIDVSPSRTGVGFDYTSPSRFLQAKADATPDGLRQATYTDEGLVTVGRLQGQHIMNTLQIKSVNLGISLKQLLTSGWQFDI